MRIVVFNYLGIGGKKSRIGAATVVGWLISWLDRLYEIIWESYNCFQFLGSKTSR